MILKTVMRHDPGQRLYRVARIIWDTDMRKLSLGIEPRWFRWDKRTKTPGTRPDYALTLFGVRLHYMRSYSGRFV